MSLIAAVIPIFNPHDSIIENIKSYAPYIDTLYIIYNSPVSIKIEKAISSLNNICILHQGDNIGVAKALNLALSKATHSNYYWLLTMDQDSSFEGNTFQSLLSSLHTISHSNLIIFSPIHNKKFIQINKASSLQEIPYVMTSGNLVNISLANKLNGYDENLFIDEVDHEFCFHARQRGFHIICDTSIALNHHLGKAHQTFSKIKLYPAIRLYYMTRNYLYLRKKYYQRECTFFKQRDRYLLKFLLKQIIFGEQKCTKLYRIYQGIKDYKQQHYGKYNHV